MGEHGIGGRDEFAHCGDDGDLDAFGGKQVAQHPAAREREIHVQRVDPPHDRQAVGLGG